MRATAHMKRSALGLLLWIAVAAGAGSDVVTAALFYARDEALALAFPDATRSEARNFFLTSEQRAEIERLAQARLDTDLVTIYIGYRGDEVIGYARFDTHLVRTLPETILVVLSPDGMVTATHLVAFYEPTEYIAGDRWRQQFAGKRLHDSLRVGRGIAAITGSTLTSRVVSDAVRRTLATHSVLIGGP